MKKLEVFNKQFFPITVLIIMISVCGCTQQKASLPNFVIIYIDDEGYGDIGCFGATGFQTPNLDLMASEGMMFTNFYSGSSVCSPARATLLTGCYPLRVGIPHVLFPGHTYGLNSEERTLAEMFAHCGQTR